MSQRMTFERGTVGNPEEVDMDQPVEHRLEWSANGQLCPRAVFQREYNVGRFESS